MALCVLDTNNSHNMDTSQRKLLWLLGISVCLCGLYLLQYSWITKPGPGVNISNMMTIMLKQLTNIQDSIEALDKKIDSLHGDISQNVNHLDITYIASEKAIQSEQTIRRQTFKQVCDEFKLPTKVAHYGVKVGSFPRELNDTGYILVDQAHHILYATVPKLATKTMVRSLIYYSGLFNSTVEFNQINFLRPNAENHGLMFLYKLNPNKWKDIIEKYYSFVIGRHPFERLVSAYTDKLNPGYRLYHRHVGRYIIKKYRSKPSQESIEKGTGVMFPEFIQYIVDLYRDGKKFNEHWIPQYQIIYPCAIQYNYIAKFETLHQDMDYIIRKLYNLNATTSLPFSAGRTGTDSSKITRFFKDVPSENIDYLREIYKYDFKLYNYSMEIQGDFRNS